MILWYSMISGHIMENPMENPIPRGPRFIWNTPHRRHGIWGTFWDQIPHVCPVCFSRMYDMDISRMRNDRGADSTDIGMRRRDIFLRFMDLWGLNILGLTLNHPHLWGLNILNWKNQPPEEVYLVWGWARVTCTAGVPRLTHEIWPTGRDGSKL